MKIKLENIGHNLIRILSLAVLFQLGCSVHKAASTTEISKSIKELHFIRTQNLTERGRNSIDSLEQLAREEVAMEHPDRVIAIPFGFISMMISDIDPSPFLLSISDTVWKTNLYDNYISYRYDTIQQKVYVYPNKKAPYTFERSYAEFDSSQLLSYTESRSDKILISGFECFKVSFVIKEDSVDANLGFGMGDEIFEMYVTEAINLPMAMVLPFQLPQVNYFPLRVIRWPSCCKGVDEITELEKVIYQE